MCDKGYHTFCLKPVMTTIPKNGWKCKVSTICNYFSQPGDDSKMLVCDMCDKGYHTFCLKPVMTTIPKNGWKCKVSTICNYFSQPGDDSKMLVCDMCDKGYHTFCLKPVMTTIPKNGWKCKVSTNIVIITVKPVLIGQSKVDKTKILKVQDKR